MDQTKNLDILIITIMDQVTTLHIKEIICFMSHRIYFKMTRVLGTYNYCEPIPALIWEGKGRIPVLEFQ